MKQTADRMVSKSSAGGQGICLGPPPHSDRLGPRCCSKDEDWEACRATGCRPQPASQVHLGLVLPSGPTSSASTHSCHPKARAGAFRDQPLSQPGECSPLTHPSLALLRPLHTPQGTLTPDLGLNSEEGPACWALVPCDMGMAVTLPPGRGWLLCAPGCQVLPDRWSGLKEPRGGIFLQQRGSRRPGSFREGFLEELAWSKESNRGNKARAGAGGPSDWIWRGQRRYMVTWAQASPGAQGDPAGNAR